MMNGITCSFDIHLLSIFCFTNLFLKPFRMRYKNILLNIFIHRFFPILDEVYSHLQQSTCTCYFGLDTCGPYRKRKHKYIPVARSAVTLGIFQLIRAESSSESF